MKSPGLATATAASGAPDHRRAEEVTATAYSRASVAGRPSKARG
ncbi:hypothetical protein AB0P41_00945 [Streptomyces sp. NPDC079167]